MKKITFILIAFLLAIAIQVSSQEICDPPCTPDETCVDIENPGEVCPVDLPIATQDVYYDETVTIIPPDTYQGFSIITAISVDDVIGLPEGMSWCKSADQFPVNTSNCCQLTGTPTVPGEYPLTLEITAYIGPVSAGTVTDDTSLLIIVHPAAPVPSFYANVTTAGTGVNIIFTDESTNNPTSWSWTFEGGTPPTSDEQNPTVQWASEGVYDVTLAVSNDGGGNSETKVDYITIDNGTGINEGISQKVKLYPNPASHQITVEAVGLESVSIVDMLGKVVYTQDANSTKQVIDISKLGKANYFVKIVTADGEITKSISIK